MNLIPRFLRRSIAKIYARRAVQQQRNDVVVLDSPHNVMMGCCDCGLIHRYDFSVNAAGKLCVRARRDYVATIAVRQARTFTHRGPVTTHVDQHPARTVPTASETDRLARFRERVANDRHAS